MVPAMVTGSGNGCNNGDNGVVMMVAKVMVMVTLTAAVAAMATLTAAVAVMATETAAVAAMMKAMAVMATAMASVIETAIAMAAAMAATTVEVVVTKRTAAPSMAGGTGNNQLKGAWKK